VPDEGQDIDLLAGAQNAQTLEERLEFFEENWPKVELLVEQAQKTKTLINKLDSYITDIKGEVATTKTIRIWVTWFTVIIILALLGVLLYFLNCKPYFFNKPYVGAALILSTISASVLLLVALVRGAYRTIRDRNKDEEVPPHIMKVLEALANHVGDGS